MSKRERLHNPRGEGIPQETWGEGGGERSEKGEDWKRDRREETERIRGREKNREIKEAEKRKQEDRREKERLEAHGEEEDENRASRGRQRAK